MGSNPKGIIYELIKQNSDAKERVITWANVNQDLCLHMAWVGQNGRRPFSCA